MADVYGRLSSYPGVCIATLGPGATNLLTGVADANLDRAPLVAITGQAGLERIHKESHQYVDVLRMFAPVVKWNARIELPETAPEIVRKAFRLARLEKPGATHIELPEDVAEREVVAVPLAVRRTRYAQAGEEAIARAAELINSAAQPILLVGNGVVRREAAGHGAVAALRSFIARPRSSATSRPRCRSSRRRRSARSRRSWVSTIPRRPSRSRTRRIWPRREPLDARRRGRRAPGEAHRVGPGVHQRDGRVRSTTALWWREALGLRTRARLVRHPRVHEPQDNLGRSGRSGNTGAPVRIAAGQSPRAGRPTLRRQC